MKNSKNKKESIFKVIGLIIILNGFFISINAQTKVQKLDSLFNNLYNTQLFNGEVLVAKDNDVLFHNYFRYADLIEFKNFSSSSSIEIASLSKPITAVAIAKLVESGQLNYDDKISFYIKNLPYQDITIKQLLTHSSGIPDCSEFFYTVWNPKEIAGNEDVLNKLIEVKPKLEFCPGSKWQYSNTGYILLSMIIEEVTGESFPEFCLEEIFIPLGMDNTYIPNYIESLSDTNYVNDYIFNYAKAKYFDPKIYPSFDNVTFTANVYGDAGVCTNAIDLYKFSRIFSDKKLIADSLLNRMMSPSGCKVDNKNEFSYGWFIGTDSIHGKYIWHTGGYCGYRSILSYYLNNKYVIIVLSNIETPIYKIRDMIEQVLFDREIIVPKSSYIKALSFNLNNEESYELPDFDSLIYKIDLNEIDYLFDDLFAIGAYKNAIFCGEKLIELVQNSSILYFYLGEAYLKNGQTDLAIENYKKSLELNPENENAKRMLEKLMI